jgi:hypothetical protein
MLVINTLIMQNNPDIVWLAVRLDLLESISRHGESGFGRCIL